MQCVYCAAENETLNVVEIILSPSRVKPFRIMVIKFAYVPELFIITLAKAA